jgi:hypothetical protein
VVTAFGFLGLPIRASAREMAGIQGGHWEKTPENLTWTDIL